MKVSPHESEIASRGLIEEKLWGFLIENCLPLDIEVNLDDEESLFDAGILDSAALISFICFIEEEFSMTIPDEDLLPENFTSIVSIASYIRGKSDSSTIQDMET